MDAVILLICACLILATLFDNVGFAAIGISLVLYALKTGLI